MVDVAQIRVNEGDGRCTARLHARGDPGRGLRVLLYNCRRDCELGVVAGVRTDVTVRALVSVDIKVVQNCPNQEQLIQIEVRRRCDRDRGLVRYRGGHEDTTDIPEVQVRVIAGA